MLKFYESEYKNYWDGEFLRFIDLGPIKIGAKTRLYQVRNIRNNSKLGSIKWFGAWRKYIFHPDAMTAYDERCLTEISEFIVARSKEYRDTIPYKEASREKRMELYRKNRLTKEAKSSKVISNEIEESINPLVEGVTPLEVTGD